MRKLPPFFFVPFSIFSSLEVLFATLHNISVFYSLYHKWCEAQLRFCVNCWFFFGFMFFVLISVGWFSVFVFKCNLYYPVSCSSCFFKARVFKFFFQTVFTRIENCSLVCKFTNCFLIFFPLKRVRLMLFRLSQFMLRSFKG